ncbi:efflux RND transporter periplasmic adaptor subunit [Ramlibacter montanisoli]|uniref:Efflux RND transporter periplasmic adaptor subunit n=1 Tax=Ramlibacter montanisoli TaxID=2732512 RepID=A0A849KB03_9BURK|nr:efflux RND transporter periplasmic adaptor subunit [Ramlibacter montanisoli]NNU41981.1 efflux RND transporter periplasmic adaptor subunit [Ramlibacter montanisoli]
MSILQAAFRRGAFRMGLALTTLAAIAVAVFIATSEGDVTASERPAPPPAVPVSVATVVQAEVAAWDEFSGRLEAVEQVDVRSRVSGAVQSVHFREGALVRAGDLLVTIDPAPYAAEVERAQAQVAAADARLMNRRSEQQRAERLWREDAIAQRELDERNDGMHEAEANLRAAQAALTSARLNLGYTQVRAPIAGRIGKFEVTAGNLVAAGPGAPVLTTLVSVHPIYASFDADEQVIVRALRDVPGVDGDRTQIDRIPVRMGTVVTDGTPHEGRLQLIDNKVDTRSGTVRVRARFDNPQGVLIPGQFARIHLGKAKASRALLVSERAVGTDQDKKFVLVVGADDKVAYREVTLGAAVDGLRIVTRGLKADERIVVNGVQRVRPGTLVQPQQVPMEAQAGAAERTAAAQRS